MLAKVIGIGAMAAGVAIGAWWALGRLTQPFAPTIALAVFLGGALLFSSIAGIARQMQPLVGRGVRAAFWGAAPVRDAEFIVHRVLSFGAGLHVWLRPWPDGEPQHLKVAQPRKVVVDERGCSIASAKYVQWRGKKLPKDGAHPALRLEISGR